MMSTIYGAESFPGYGHVTAHLHERYSLLNIFPSSFGGLPFHAFRRIDTTARRESFTDSAAKFVRFTQSKVNRSKPSVQSNYFHCISGLGLYPPRYCGHDRYAPSRIQSDLRRLPVSASVSNQAHGHLPSPLHRRPPLSIENDC